MDLLLYSVAFVMGALTYFLVLGRRGVNKFEKDVMRLLLAGKTVTIAVNETCHIYKIVDGKIRVTQGTTSFEDEVDDGFDSDFMDSGDSH